jgi:hypothetical protein
MSVDSAYSPDRGITKCLLVEEFRTTREKRLVVAAKRGCDAAFDELCRPYETAQILDVTISAAKARLYHARAALAVQLL